MKKGVLFAATAVCLAGCSWFRPSGSAYPGYSCRKALTHYYVECYNSPFDQEWLNRKVSDCEYKLSAKVCDKELADLLWCQGRTEQGIITHVGGMCFGGICGGNGETYDGCDCSDFDKKLRQCYFTPH